MSSMLAFTTFQLIMALAIFAICLLLMMIILIQKGRGGGLASAFGGGGGGGGAFGAKTGDVFTGITVVLAGVYLILTVCGNFVFRPDTGTAQAAAVEEAAGGAASAPAPASSPGTQTIPINLPPGARQVDPDKARTSVGEAVKEGAPAQTPSGQPAATTPPAATEGTAPPAGAAEPNADNAAAGGEAAGEPEADAPAEGAADDPPADQPTDE
jgi:preprotein translocase subunit SecG